MLFRSTGLQIGWQLLMVLVCMFFAPGIRELLIVNFLLILLFAVFRYHPKHLPILSFLLLCSYMLVILAQVIWSPVVVHWQHELITSLVFVLGLIGVSLLGVEIGSLRVALKRRNEHLALLTAKNEQLAVTDDLTGLYNRRHLMRILRRQKSLSDRGGYQFSLGFKTAGNELTRGSVQLTKVDYVARIGGEEFVVVLSQTDYAEALRIAERLRADIAQLEINLGEEQPAIALTASLGIATYRPTETINDLIHRGDSAAYAAKNCGRNCIVGEEELPEALLNKTALDEVAVSDAALAMEPATD